MFAFIGLSVLQTGPNKKGSQVNHLTCYNQTTTATPKTKQPNLYLYHWEPPTTHMNSKQHDKEEIEQNSENKLISLYERPNLRTPGV